MRKQFRNQYICARCGVSFVGKRNPLTATYCGRQCANSNRERPRRPAVAPPLPEGRVCSQCGEYKSADNFSWQRGAINPRLPWSNDDEPAPKPADVITGPGEYQLEGCAEPAVVREWSGRAMGWIVDMPKSAIVADGCPGGSRIYHSSGKHWAGVAPRILGPFVPPKPAETPAQAATPSIGHEANRGYQEADSGRIYTDVIAATRAILPDDPEFVSDLERRIMKKRASPEYQEMLKQYREHVAAESPAAKDEREGEELRQSIVRQPFAVDGPGDYRTRDGRKAVVEYIASRSNEIRFSVGYIVGHIRGVVFWELDGKYDRGVISAHDLVSKWVEPLPIPPKPAALEPFLIENADPSQKPRWCHSESKNGGVFYELDWRGKRVAEYLAVHGWRRVTWRRVTKEGV